MQNTLHKIIEATWWFPMMTEFDQPGLVSQAHSFEEVVHPEMVVLEQVARSLMDEAVPFSLDWKTYQRLEPIVDEAQHTAWELWTENRLRLPYPVCFFTIQTDETPQSRRHILVKQDFSEDEECGAFLTVTFVQNLKTPGLSSKDKISYYCHFQRPKGADRMNPEIYQFAYLAPCEKAMDYIDRGQSHTFSETIFACIMTNLGLLHTRGVAAETVAADKAENKRRVRRGSPAIRDTIQIKINQPHKTGSKLNGVRKAPRVHWRRGHLWGRNTRPAEQQHWRSPTLVGLGQDCDPLMDGYPPVPTYQVAA